MGLFDWFGGKKNNEEPSWEERNAYTGETPPCPRCGTPLNMICTPFTGHPVEGVLLCGTHMSTKGNV